MNEYQIRPLLDRYCVIKDLPPVTGEECDYNLAMTDATRIPSISSCMRWLECHQFGEPELVEPVEVETLNGVDWLNNRPLDSELGDILPGPDSKPQHNPALMQTTSRLSHPIAVQITSSAGPS